MTTRNQTKLWLRNVKAVDDPDWSTSLQAKQFIVDSTTTRYSSTDSQEVNFNEILLRDDRIGG
jgi:hypothetical protein